MSDSTFDERILSFRLENGNSGESSVEIIQQEDISIIDLNTQVEQHAVENMLECTVNGRELCECLRCNEQLLDEYLKAILSNQPLSKSVKEAAGRLCRNAANEGESGSIDDMDFEGRLVIKQFLENQLKKG